MRKIFITAILTLMCTGAWAVPAYPGLIERVQPNGDTLRIYVRGDEHAHFAMTEDGWLIAEDKKGWLRYMRKDRKGVAHISRRKAHNAERRSKCEVKWLAKKGVQKIKE